MRARRIQRSRRTWGLALVLAVVVIAGGCSDDDDGADPTTTAPTSTTTSAVTTTTAPPETTTTTVATTVATTAGLTTAPPPSVTTALPPPTEIDWVGVMTDFYARQAALYAAPDVAKVREIALEGSEAYVQLEENIAALVADGEIFRQNAPLVVSAEVLDIDDPAMPLNVRLDVRLQPPQIGGTLVDAATGELIAEVPVTETSNRNSFSLTRLGPDQPWLQIEQFGLLADEGG